MATAAFAKNSTTLSLRRGLVSVLGLLVFWEIGRRLHFQRCERTETTPWRVEDCRLHYAALAEFLRTGGGEWRCELDWGAQLVLTDEDPTRVAACAEVACTTA